MGKAIALIGAGLIGRSWAIVFAKAGYAVRVFDQSREAAEQSLNRIESSLDDLVTLDLLADKTSVLSNISVCETIEQACADAVYVQESVPEDLHLKTSVSAEIDKAAATQTVVGSSASGIPASAFTEGLPGQSRFLVAHPANPPHLLPLVEIVPTPATDERAVSVCRDILISCGQVPVMVHAEIYGFVMNRLQAAVINEAMSLVGKGVMSPDDIDATMRYSIGRRWAFMGPFETMDLNAPDGFADYCQRFETSYRTIGRDLDVKGNWSQNEIAAIEKWRRSAVPSSGLASRQAWRDTHLAKIGEYLANAVDHDRSERTQ